MIGRPLERTARSAAAHHRAEPARAAPFAAERRLRLHTRLAALVLHSLILSAVSVDAAAQQSPEPVSAGSLLQVLIGLAVVLVVLAGFAWVMRRLGPLQGGAGQVVRVLGGASVGTRERIVLVEVADTWLVVGVAPGQVRALATLPRGEVPAAAAPAPGGAFAAALKRVTERRRAG